MLQSLCQWSKEYKRKVANEVMSKILCYSNDTTNDTLDSTEETFDLSLHSDTANDTSDSTEETIDLSLLSLFDTNTEEEFLVTTTSGTDVGVIYDSDDNYRTESSSGESNELETISGNEKHIKSFSVRTDLNIIFYLVSSAILLKVLTF